ncbi:MAG: hypothetical protein KDD58_15050 [Bdellovibrionales bacterium]|nr:hypothetical protein [Bdellovibrionales bacterium]
MLRFRGLFCLLTLCLSWQASAIVLLFSDYDNTITKDRENGNWVTYYELHRVHSTAISAIPIPLDQPNKIFISHKDWEDYEQLFSQGEGHTGYMLEAPLYDGINENGKTLESFIPGYFQKVGSLTYSRYRGDHYFGPDALNPVNYWREDRNKAKELTAQGKGTHIGPGHELMSYFLSDPYLRSGFRLVTARGYPDHAIMEVFKDMQKDGEINLLPLINPNGKPLSFWALGHPQFGNRWSTSSLHIKKSMVILEAANQWRMTPPVEQVLNPDGTNYDYYHTFIIQEDNPKYIDAMVKIAQEITRRGVHFIKFVIRHMGTLEEVEANQFYVSNGNQKQRSRDIVIKNDGSFRKAKKEEIFIDKKIAQQANERLNNACQRILERGEK